MFNERLARVLTALILFSGFLTPLVGAEDDVVLFVYQGPDTSPDLMRLTGFTVFGPSTLDEGDTIRIEFQITNFGQSTVALGPLGVFAVASDPSQAESRFGNTHGGEELNPGGAVDFSASLELGKAGTWVIWPSYQLESPTGMRLGPDYWHSAALAVSERELPDLVVTEVKFEDGAVGYVLKNAGEATAPGGHRTALLIDGNEAGHDRVEENLGPGEHATHWFDDYALPTAAGAEVVVYADYLQQVEEEKENNNYLLRSYEAEPPPSLIITSGPAAEEATQSSVTVKWTTDRPATSTVYYKEKTAQTWTSVVDPEMTTQHSLQISELRPGATYSYYVESMDDYNNFAKSPQGVFETLAPEDDVDPTVAVILPEEFSGVVTVSATASDNVEVGGVKFSVDGVTRHTDYSPPYSWECNTTLFADGLHTFSATAFDASRNQAVSERGGVIDNPSPERMAPTVTITAPVDGDEVVGRVMIESTIEEETGWIARAEVHIDGVYTRGWTYSMFVFDIREGRMVHNPARDRMTFSHLWSTEGLAFGTEHTIEVRAWDNLDNMGRSVIRVSLPTVETAPPVFDLKVVAIDATRDVERVDNYYRVTLQVRNRGTETLDDLTVTDHASGFQAIHTQAYTTIAYDTDGHSSEVTMFMDPTDSLEAGETATFRYYAVPILYREGDAVSHTFGPRPTRVHYRYEGTHFSRNFSLSRSPSDLDAALRTANYLIITNPGRLHTYSPLDADGVNSLLVNAAELARIKRGVLGYLSGEVDAWRIVELIEPGGAWASRLDSCFDHPDVEDAYVLLIGETEIVPSKTLVDIDLSDHYYADVVGDCAPDLIVGRIIGDSPDGLVKPIQASIEVAEGRGFDRSRALCTSGYEDSVTHRVVDIAYDMLGDLNDQGVGGETLHWCSFVEHAWTVDFTDYDAMTLGDVDGDDMDEVIIARDETSRIYIYEAMPRTLIRDFPCRFTRHDGLAAGDLDGDGLDEIVVAVDDDGEDGTIYVYGPDGALIGATEMWFKNWDQVDCGDVIDDAREEVVIAVRRHNGMCLVYSMVDSRHPHSGYSTGQLHFEDAIMNIDTPDFRFTSYDGFAVGNVMGEDWSKDEIILIRDDDNTMRIFTPDGMVESFEARFTHYDGFAVGDVDEDGKDEMVVVIDEDERICVYQDNGRFIDDAGDPAWKHVKLFSRYMNDWFHGIRYTSSTTRHDCLAVGDVLPGENGKVAILRNRDGVTSSFQVFVSTWGDADEWANERVHPTADEISFLTVFGHGNPLGASPLGWDWAHLWGDFEEHPFVICFGCLTGDYNDPRAGDNSFGEALFNHGAAVFIGSTENSYGGECYPTSEVYFERWDIWGERAGKFFTDYERSRYSRGWWSYWVHCFNYYGDPKFPTGGR